MRRLIAFLSTFLVLVVSVIVLFGLLGGGDLGYLSAFVQYLRLEEITALFLRITVITVAVTLLIGVVNLLTVHFGRIGRQQRGWPYSLVLVFSFLSVIVLSVLERRSIVQTAPGQRSPSTILLESVQISIESALAALLLFALVYGAYRIMRRRVSWAGVLFTLALLIVLLGALPLPGIGLSVVGQLRNWLLAVPVSAGARGILLGIALATVVAGVRVFTGQDRAYRE